MMSSDAHRIKVDPEYIAAMALVKLGSGNNMPGYYMYQGGVNPSGEGGASGGGSSECDAGEGL